MFASVSLAIVRREVFEAVPRSMSVPVEIVPVRPVTAGEVSVLFVSVWVLSVVTSVRIALPSSNFTTTGEVSVRIQILARVPDE